MPCAKNKALFFVNASRGLARVFSQYSGFIWVPNLKIANIWKLYVEAWTRNRITQPMANRLNLHKSVSQTEAPNVKPSNFYLTRRSVCTVSARPPARIESTTNFQIRAGARSTWRHWKYTLQGRAQGLVCVWLNISGFLARESSWFVGFWFWPGSLYQHVVLQTDYGTT